jgi:hypothetical protein
MTTNIPEVQQAKFWFPETAEAVALADFNANEQWKKAAADCVRTIAYEKPFFTADDVMNILTTKPVKTRDLRALGPVMVRAVKNKLIQKTEKAVSSTRGSRHNCPIRVWKSLVFKEDVC